MKLPKISKRNSKALFAKGRLFYLPNITNHRAIWLCNLLPCALIIELLSKIMLMPMVIIKKHKLQMDINRYGFNSCKISNYFRIASLFFLILCLQGCLYKSCFDKVYDAMDKTGKPAQIIDRGSSPILGTKCEVIYK